MTVQCANCGEELLGSVNRCWRCGHALRAHSGPTDIPPIRRPPIRGPLDAPLEAVLVDPVEGEVKPPAARRHGSPFAANGRITRIAAPPAPNRAPRESHTGFRSAANKVQALAGAASFTLALIALPMCASFPLGAMLIALAALGFAIWGLSSQKRSVALAGLLFSCIVLAISAFLVSLVLYRMLNGTSAFR